MQQEIVMQQNIENAENNTGGLTMNATTREVDTITIKDLPGYMWRGIQRTVAV